MNPEMMPVQQPHNEMPPKPLTDDHAFMAKLDEEDALRRKGVSSGVEIPKTEIGNLSALEEESN